MNNNRLLGMMTGGLLIPFASSASEVQHIMDGFSDMLIGGLFVIFVIALNVRAFYTNTVLHYALAINGLLLLILLYKTDEDNITVTLPTAALLLLLGVGQLVVSKRRG